MEKKKIFGRVSSDGKEYEIEALAGMTALEAICTAGISLYSPCGGNGTCGKCRAKITGEVSPMDEKEASFLRKDECENGIRLSCMCHLLGDFEINIQFGNMRVQTDAKHIAYTLSPVLSMKKEGNESIFYRDNVIFCRDGADARNLGLAVDIGTTTVAVYVCDMEDGTIIGTRAFRNPQCVYGADVISRIDKIMKDKDALSQQQKMIADAICGAVMSVCKESELSETDVRFAVICGNTVMQHIAANIDPSSIANAPFISPSLFGEDYSAYTLGFLKNPNAVVYFAPCFASYVGGDIACGMIATGLDACRENVLFVDIGTNGEIGLSTKNGLYFCSAAAGPAFEGAHISCGMAGTDGAIGEILVDGNKICYRTIGGGKPIGICGSGIIDAVAVMLECGFLDETGCILERNETSAFGEYIEEDEDGNPCFMIDRENNIYINGKDIREVQLAKAAVCAGVDTLLRRADIGCNDLNRVVIAGGFGSHIEAKNACRIGLLPSSLSEKICCVGNAAGAGALAVLLGKEPRESSKMICSKSDYTELSQDPYFMEKYIEEMMFEI